MSQAKSLTALAEAVSWYSAMLLALMLVLSCCEPGEGGEFSAGEMKNMENLFSDRACDEIYVVREGETLHTISEKCGDPFIVEENPHIHDPDDVFPGLVIKITPFKNR
ncbi:hypothetical protein CDL12_22060 [Handroanthus impetiginosus]|uniref:LysM domain-containing protein n=1 Tax=Handroanthus impetiginosus TaxID=429701 RepID=A0A2G9GJE3_9LAMI|nr:hypothetical protein CDL12_22060 [Handroanthus impetiginosus]